MDEKQFKQEYLNWKRQSAPDLWDRIERKLNDYPEREQERAETFTVNGVSDSTNRKTSRKMKRKVFYGAAAGAAAVIGLMVAVPGLYRGLLVEQSSGGNAYETSLGAEMGAEISAETMAENEGKTELEEKADSVYFSQAVLADTELLCAGRIEEVSLEYDEQGRAVSVCYAFAVNQVYYAQDYFTASEKITVKSPIVRAEGNEEYLLYQMKKEKTYLLPMKKQEENWELVYPFAPQIQVTDTQGYLFHSGYSSLMNEKTRVVQGEQEGENDYFYDRMLLREDEEFIADFMRLVEEQANIEANP